MLTFFRLGDAHIALPNLPFGLISLGSTSHTLFLLSRASFLVGPSMLRGASSVAGLLLIFLVGSDAHTALQKHLLRAAADCQMVKIPVRLLAMLMAHARISRALT